MFEYAALFIAAVIMATVVLWLYRAVVGAGKAVYQAILPSSKTEADDPTHHVEDERLALTVNDTRTPWGWREHSTPARAARAAEIATVHAVPWGWPGNDREIRNHEPTLLLASHSLTDSESPVQAVTEAEPEDRPNENVGWPYREEKFDFAGKAYKVVRKESLEITNLSTTDTPWGW